MGRGSTITHLVRIEKDVQQFAQFCVQYAAIEEEDNAERLVLSRDSNIKIHRQVGDASRASISATPISRGGAFIAKPVMAFDPVHIGLFGPEGVVFKPDNLSNLVEKKFSGHGGVWRFIVALLVS